MRRARNIRAEDFELKKGPSNNCCVVRFIFITRLAISKSPQEYSVIYCEITTVAALVAGTVPAKYRAVTDTVTGTA